MWDYARATPASNGRYPKGLVKASRAGTRRTPRQSRTPRNNGPVNQGPEPDLKIYMIGSQAVTFDRHCQEEQSARGKRDVNQLWCRRGSTDPYLAVPVSARQGLLDQKELLRHFLNRPYSTVKRAPGAAIGLTALRPTTFRRGHLDPPAGRRGRSICKVELGRDSALPRIN